MTLTFPTTGFSSMPSWGGSSSSGSSAFPSLASFKTPSMTGATGNTLYPAPSSSSGFSFPSFGAGGGSSSAFPSLADYFTKQPGGILGGSGQAPALNLPSLGGGTAARSGGSTLGPGPWQLPSMGGAASAVPGGSSGAKTPPPAFSPGSSMSMPGGFASQLFGSGGLNSPLATSAYGASAGVTGMQPQASSSPAALTQANARATGNKRVTQGGLTYTALAGSQTKNGDSPPILRQTAANPAPGSVSTARDQYGKEFNYAASVDASGGKVVGISADGTVLKQTVGADGQPVIYDTGATATRPRQPAQAPAQQPVAIGRPTQASQPKSTPVIPAPSAYPGPSQDELATANQGRWLG